MTAESRIASGVVGAVALVALTLYGLQNWTFVGEAPPMARPPKVLVEKRDPAPPAAPQGRGSGASAGHKPAAQPVWSSLGASGTLQDLYDASLRSP